MNFRIDDRVVFDDKPGKIVDISPKGMIIIHLDTEFNGSEFIVCSSPDDLDLCFEIQKVELNYTNGLNLYVNDTKVFLTFDNQELSLNQYDDSGTDTLQYDNISKAFRVHMKYIEEGEFSGEMLELNHQINENYKKQVIRMLHYVIRSLG